MQRTILIVLDGVGCGALPDAPAYGDPDSNTLGHVAEAYPQLKLPNLARWGLGHLTPMSNVPAIPTEKCVASFGRCRELSNGKDTTSGHWEMAGIVVKKPFKTFSDGFAKEVVDRWAKENNLPGVLGNYAASGTDILKDLGEEHLRTGKPILYTSADSVWQVAAHEEKFGLDRLYSICKSARKICDELQVARVIARPFVGASAKDFKRTYRRKDYSQSPPAKTMMEIAIENGQPVVGVGKIWNIFNGHGIQTSLESKDNADGMRVLLEALDKHDRGLIFVNLIDFDMLYGHRRDVDGFAKALEEFDAYLPMLEAKLKPSDLVLISADHGNDPTYRGTDHTREYVPLLAYGKGLKARALGDRGSFADIGQTVLHALTGKANLLGTGTTIFPEWKS